MFENLKSLDIRGFLSLLESKLEAADTRFDPSFKLHPLGHQNSLEKALFRLFL
jgi:hypothetical protein